MILLDNLTLFPWLSFITVKNDYLRRRENMWHKYVFNLLYCAYIIRAVEALWRQDTMFNHK